MRRLMVLLVGFVSFSGVSQAYINFEKNNSILSDANFRGIGASFQYMLPVGNINLPGFSIGAISEQELTRGERFLSVPVDFHLRHYFLSSHNCFFGAYIEGNVGAKFQMQGIGNSDFNNTTYFQCSGGVGVQLFRTVDVNLRAGRNISDNLQYNFVGLRAGLRF